MKLGEWITYWQENYDKPNHRPSTYQAHNYVFQNHILPKLGSLELADLTEERIGAFLEERRRFGNHRPETPDYPGLGYSAMRHIHQLLKQCLDQAVRDGVIPQNPAKAFRYPDKKTVKAEPLTAAEVEAYLDAAEELGHLPMFLLELTTGLHQRELIALKWSDLNPIEQTLTIWEERIVERRELVEYGNRKRTIMLTEEVVKQLEQEHSKHPSSPLMFIHPGTLRSYSPNMVRLLHSKISEKAGLDHVRFEDLRHTYAVNALQNGAKVKELAHLLGLGRSHTVRKHYGQYMLKDEQTKGEVFQLDIELDELKKASEQIEEFLKF